MVLTTKQGGLESNTLTAPPTDRTGLSKVLQIQVFYGLEPDPQIQELQQTQDINMIHLHGPDCGFSPECCCAASVETKMEADLQLIMSHKTFIVMSQMCHVTSSVGSRPQDRSGGLDSFRGTKRPSDCGPAERLMSTFVSDCLTLFDSELVL
ncbi:hypothetical protein INR49_014623 [Caranx melampygus]|nr:hypothetical protein INR49_014623 [Caranx melampygus]